jgi:hypothetical protein
LSGLEAVERVECVICPNGVARVPAVAEGLALAGVRAASLSNGLPTRSAAGIAALEASCVHHVDGAGARERGGVFEFAAASAQEAVDHCLAAHLLSRRLGRPGVCSLAPFLGEDLKLVRLPGAALIAALLEADKEPPELDAEADRILELAQEALRAVGDRTERPGNLVD